ncbi:PAS domain-containing protein [Roseibium sp. RKSG952]|uniref:PAS domain-containing protein n=1 Tax=Roseibium sp. RKSG952 TaxID=2529384 RepID=UPI0012BD46E3|nr:PAS domain-containing protein [Roseibium sp. RKSG952]MTH99414.1 PAS domain-containing protein [Roseibium sp. RKSG952]
MKNGVTRTLYTYWDELRGFRPSPDRSDIDPGQIRALLGDTFILESSSARDVRYRLAGTRLCSAHCRELKGRKFLRGWNEKDREALESLITAVTEDAGVAVIGVCGHTEHDQKLPMEMLLLPLNVPGEGRVRVLGCCSPMTRPYWMGLHPLLKQSITSLRLIWPDERPHHLRSDTVVSPVVPRKKSEDVATPSSSHMPPCPVRQVGHLTVYAGGKA